MADFKVKKGYEVPIQGQPEGTISESSHPPFVGLCPVMFAGVKARLEVQVDDQVKVGTPLFFDKKNPDVHFTAPASGRVTAINYGPRRVIEEIIIATDQSYEYESFPAHEPAQISGLARQDLVGQLTKMGLWPLIRKRPFNKIPDPGETPKSIFVNCMDTAPLANDPNISLDGRETPFAAGVAALKVLCDKVFVNARHNSPNAMFQKPQGVSYNTFSGKHPAGLVGTHITHLDPINKGETVWYLNARDVVLIGQSLLDGKLSVERVVAVAGPSVPKPHYIRAQVGMRIQDIVGENVEPGDQRYISGNVLNGAARSNKHFLGFYDDLITILPEGREQYFLGWMDPGLSKPSFTRAFLSSLIPGKKFKMNTNLNGGHRAIIASGNYDRVVALDLFPEYLVKATIVKDIDAMERLGILECDPEDFALCTYICPSKTDVSQIIADGLELMEKEG